MSPEQARISPAWRAGLIRLGVVWAGLIALFWPAWRAMAHQWWDSSTYHHILMVPVIVAWLVAQRLPDLWRVPVGIWGWGLAPMGAALLLWWLGALGGFAALMQMGAVGMLVAAVPFLLGIRAGVGLAFPLAYMGFLVPVGDEIVPLLQMVTARITVVLAHLSGIQAQSDGVFIATPAGLFEVAEACSGVKFLMAMIAFGALAAHVGFARWGRRAGFMALCVVVPVLANGVRAWGTVFLAQIYGRAIAGGIDHILYGWVFFAAVIALVIAAGWRWFDRPAGAPMIDVVQVLAWPPGAGMSAPLAFCGLGVMLGVVLGWAAAADWLMAPMPARIDLPPVPGWHRVAYAPQRWWQPRAGGADRRLLARYADERGHVVDVFYALYAAQGPGRKAGGFGEGALPEGGAWAWAGPGGAVADARVDRLRADEGVLRLAQTSYRTGDVLTGSNLVLKLANIRDRVMLRRRATMMLILSAEGQDAAPSLAAFRAGVGPLGAWMDRLGKGL